MEDPLHITKTTFRVADFLAWQRHKALDLRPPFQRGSVWNKKAKSLFIDSIIRGFPVPLVFLKDQTDPHTFEPKRLVVDGQQRLRTVIAFIDSDSLLDSSDLDHFTISRSHNPDPQIYGRPFVKLPKEAKQRILDFEFSVHVLPPATPNRVLLDMFARLNSTGTRLSHQEVRNAEFTGEFKLAAYRNAYDQLDRWLEWKVFKPSQIAGMKDVELTSELMMLVESGIRGKSQPAIRRTYEDNDGAYPLQDRVALRLNATFDKIDELSNQMQGGLAASSFNSQSWFYVLFEFIHVQLYPIRLPGGSDRPKKVRAPDLSEHLSTCEAKLAEGGLDKELLKSLRGAAADKSSREARLKFLRSDS